jgi:hypothetical protein
VGRVGAVFDETTRRTFLNICGVLLSLGARGARAGAIGPVINLSSAPIEVIGIWGASPSNAAAVVISRMRQACLSGLRLFSDQQPDRLRVEDEASGPPHIWLHKENPTTAWIVVDIGTRAWSQLAYQFGHELGHVMCNSWMWKVETPPPCRWVEECLAEAFAIRGLARLADSWENDPPFVGDAHYGQALRDYRRDLLNKYQNAAGSEPIRDMAGWLRAKRPRLDGAAGLSDEEGPAILTVLNAMEAETACVEDVGAVNRWPERSGLPLEDYLWRWRRSCEQLKLSGLLPARLQEIFKLR